MRTSQPACSVWAAMLVVLVAGVAGCGKDEDAFPRVTKGLNAVTTAMIGVECACADGYPDKDFAKDFGDVANELNAWFARIVEEENYIQTDNVRKQGFLARLGPDGQEVFVDGWGRPLVFQMPDKVPQGVICTTVAGDVRIAPLPESVWPPDEKGPVQIWSLGPDGIDNRGRGDDILPN